MTLKISWKSPFMWLYLGGALLLIAAVFLWCFKLSMDPERVFWNTIERSLSTHGVTVQSEQTNNGTKSEQTIRYSLGADNLSHTLINLSQGNTTIVNEVISTPTSDYTRYVSVKTDQKKKDGTAMDFSKVVGVWAKGQTAGQFFPQALFGSSLPVGGAGVVMGNLSPEKRAELVKQIQDDVVYQIDFSKTKKQRVNGRTQYAYSAKIQPVAYLAMIKKFAQGSGLHGLDQLNPEDYKGQQPFELEITVDARSRQVVAITAPATGAKQTYHSHDVPVQITPPKEAISGAELQGRWNDLQ